MAKILITFDLFIYCDIIMTTNTAPTTTGSTGPSLYGGKSKLIAVIGDEVC